MIWDIVLILVVLIAFIFLLTNGLHDASSVVATIIACGAATPKQAVGLAALSGFLGALLGGTAVAHTISSLIRLPANNQLLIILLAALIAAVAWNVLTWHLGLPSSSTHSLVGGLIGAVWISAGADAIAWGQSDWETHRQISGIIKVFVSLVISPIIGFFVAYLLQRAAKLALRNARFSINIWFKRTQWIIAGILAFNHGSNDTQKITGLIALALVAGNSASYEQVPLWSQLLGGLVMFAGTIFGGWAIMKTLGRKIFPLRPLHSFNSLLSSGGSLLLANFLGAPISTTHLVAGTIIGVGSAEEYRMVNWEIGKQMVLAWFITIPASAAMAGIAYFILDKLIDRFIL
jgi:inorganic phosphate transporter, PiT family